MRGARTQKIPAWSKQITANGPEDMAQAFARQAAALRISTGELLRQLWILGAKAKFPKLARELIASHKKYYPARSILAIDGRMTGSAGLLVLFVAGLLLQGGHHLQRPVKRGAKARDEVVLTTEF